MVSPNIVAGLFVVSNVPFPVAMKIFPLASAAIPAPLIQKPPLPAVCSGDEHGLLGKGRSLIGKQPTMIRKVIAVGGESNVHRPIHQKQPGPTELGQCQFAEGQLKAIRALDAAVASAADGRVDDDRSGGFLRTRRNIDRV